MRKQIILLSGLLVAAVVAVAFAVHSRPTHRRQILDLAAAEIELTKMEHELRDTLAASRARSLAGTSA